MIKSSKSPKDIFFNMCKSHNFLMISNCDFLSSDIVLSKSASSGLSVDGLRVRLQMSSFSHLPSLPRTARLPGPALSLNSLYSAGDGNVARSKSHWPPHKPEKARAEPSRAISWRSQSHQTQDSDQMKSWDDFVTVARAARSLWPHHTITKYFICFIIIIGERLISASVGLAFNPCNNNPTQPGGVRYFTWWRPGHCPVFRVTWAG